MSDLLLVVVGGAVWVSRSVGVEEEVAGLEESVGLFGAAEAEEAGEVVLVGGVFDVPQEATNSNTAVVPKASIHFLTIKTPRLE